MKALALAVVVLCLPIAAQAADLGGRWSGTFVITRPDGDRKDDTALLVLKQNGADLTGTAGPNEEKQWPIQNGRVEGDRVTFDVSAEGHLLNFNLTLVDGHLRGEAKGEPGKRASERDAGPRSHGVAEDAQRDDRRARHGCLRRIQHLRSRRVRVLLHRRSRVLPRQGRPDANASGDGRRGKEQHLRKGSARAGSRGPSRSIPYRATGLSRSASTASTSRSGSNAARPARPSSSTSGRTRTARGRSLASSATPTRPLKSDGAPPTILCGPTLDRTRRCAKAAHSGSRFSPVIVSSASAPGRPVSGTPPPTKIL